ncbi:hypothetical protein BYT27DRAFT_7258310 [Phlegmacium glaucopus]|nr:hypothetical protein BYT27DRAFT_7258310 [Phlegmacium glaucopus]
MSSSSSSSSQNPPDNEGANHGIGLSDPRLFERERKMLDLINRMHNTGVQIDMDLPQIAVIGQQSAGKSSVIEAISGITLPRSSGTCTRCPTECRLSRSQSPWKCVVSLRFTSSSHGRVRNETFGPVIYDKGQVEERIRRAQRAILNPSKPSQQFLTDSEDVQQSEKTFSEDCVSLQISGPDVADLSFCDLPGLISTVSSSRGGTGDISLVQNLVTSYIKKPSCIILLTITCETDFENQGANHLTKVHDPNGNRTVGVLTKPDRIPAGEAENWLSFIRSERELLTNGWYAVKQPGSKAIESGITWEQAREEEDRFFATEPGWSDLDTIYQKYLRTTNLVARLSEILSDLISKRLPEIQKELDKSISETREHLNKLPKPPSSDPVNEICSMIYNFTSDLARHVEGVPEKDGLLQVIRPAQENFRKAIRATAPNFLPYEEKLKANRNLSLPTFLSNEEDQNESTDDAVAGPDENNPIYIDAVMERAHQAHTRELPDHYPFVVQRTFIDGVTKKWRSPAINLSTSVHKAVSEHVQKLVKEHFGSYGQGILEQRVRGIVQQHVTHCVERTEERISWLIALEDRPFSMNTHYLSDYRSKFLAYYKGSREKYEHTDLMKVISSFLNPQSPQGPRFPQAANSFPAGIAKVMAGLAEIGMNGIKPEDLPKLLPLDKMEPALMIMADVRAYFQVAYKRFVDNIPLAIDLELVRGLERGIHSSLYANIGVSGPDATSICQKLAEESPGIARDRADLLKKLERLENASRELVYF